MLTRPRALTRGGHIAVIAPASTSEIPRIEIAVRYLEARGMRVTLTGNIDHRHRTYLAGPDEERAAELNRCFRSPEFDAFFCSRGGYGTMRILDALDFDAIRSNPRPIIGFSDITALHQAVACRAGVSTFHGPMLNLDFHDGLSPEIEEWFWAMLAGEAPLVRRFAPEDVVFEGDATGPLFGGCMSLTQSLLGTAYDFWPDGGIWFWEEVEESAYRLDRMLTHLRLSGRIDRIRGVVIGRLKGCGTDAEMLDLLRDFFLPYGIPVVRDLPFGHHGDNLLMPIGVPVRLSTAGQTLTILEPAVSR